jgi:hypothetical protein
MNFLRLKACLLAGGLAGHRPADRRIVVDPRTARGKLTGCLGAEAAT